MSDKGIIFSAPMVRALLARRKTQTRRLIKAPADMGLSYVVALDDAPGWFGNEEGEVCFSAGYKPGQRLYVRESWHVRSKFSDFVEVGYRASERSGRSEYVAQIPTGLAVPGKGAWPEFPKYGPSIHMPRWASRIWLAVTEVRVQRLQECSEADAKAEGIEGFACVGGNAWRDYSGGAGFNVRDQGTPAKRSYSTLWNSLHTADGERWEDNPWVVAVSFDVHRGNIDQVPA